jgi:transposase
VKKPTARKGFVLLPRRWVVEHSFAWATRFRWLAKDSERLPQTLAGLHYLVFAMPRLHRFVDIMARSSYYALGTISTYRLVLKRRIIKQRCNQNDLQKSGWIEPA